MILCIAEQQSIGDSNRLEKGYSIPATMRNPLNIIYKYKMLLGLQRSVPLVLR